VLCKRAWHAVILPVVVCGREWREGGGGSSHIARPLAAALIGARRSPAGCLRFLRSSTHASPPRAAVKAAAAVAKVACLPTLGIAARHLRQLNSRLAMLAAAEMHTSAVACCVQPALSTARQAPIGL
jgi:hypothetical protein